jgi:predicted DNA-binding mobile mystery protein A
MSGRQLARRVKLSPQRIAVIEKQELDGTLTLNTLRKIAEGLDCALVFSLVPRTSLEQILGERVERVVQKRLAKAGHLMDLEGQGLALEERQQIQKEMVADLLGNPPSTLWNEL